MNGLADVTEVTDRVKHAFKEHQCMLLEIGNQSELLDNLSNSAGRAAMLPLKKNDAEHGTSKAKRGKETKGTRIGKPSRGTKGVGEFVEKRRERPRVILTLFLHEVTKRSC